MTGKTWLSVFCDSIKNGVDQDIAVKVLAGSELQNEENKLELCKWLLDAMARMDELVGRDQKIAIMKKMGYECAIQHNAHIEAKKKRDQFASLDQYIDSEERNPFPGYCIKRLGNKIEVTYTPSAMGCNCYCGPWQVLEKGRKTTMTFCQCSAGHVEYIWRHVTGKPVSVEVACSTISGSQNCRFLVDLAADAAD